MSSGYDKLFQSWEIAVAKRLVHEFQNAWTCLGREDFDDLLQECLIHWYQAKGEYDRSRGASLQTFMGRVIRNKLMDIVRECEADKRKVASLTVSLDDPVRDGEDGKTWLEQLDHGPTETAAPDPTNKVLLKADLSKAFRKLTPQQERLCRLIGDSGLTVTEASECLKTPRSTIYDEIERIRTIFEKEGLKEYLQ
ncbi:MAG: sigma-70 family RNA polymerase sigma factor [bacterium]